MHIHSTRLRTACPSTTRNVSPVVRVQTRHINQPSISSQWSSPTPPSIHSFRTPSRSNSSRRSVIAQANLFTRLARIFKSYTDSFVNSFEQPEKLLDRIVIEIQDDVVRLRQATAQVMASRKQIERKLKPLQDSADQWMKRAELAVAAGQDDLAREALRRRKQFLDEAEKLSVQVKQLVTSEDQLSVNMRALEGKLNEAKTKKESLKARAATAKSSLQIQEMVGSLKSNSGSAWSAFEKMEEKVTALEAEADFASAAGAPDKLESQFLALEGGTSVEDELAAIKNNKPKYLARPVESHPIKMDSFLVHDEFEPEMEELRRRARAR